MISSFIQTSAAAAPATTTLLEKRQSDPVGSNGSLPEGESGRAKPEEGSQGEDRSGGAME